MRERKRTNRKQKKKGGESLYVDVDGGSEDSEELNPGKKIKECPKNKHWEEPPPPFFVLQKSIDFQFLLKKQLCSKWKNITQWYLNIFGH